MRRVDSLINTKKEHTTRRLNFMDMTDISVAHGIINRNNPDWNLTYDQSQKFFRDAEAKGYIILLVNDDHLKLEKDGKEAARIPEA